MHSLPSFAELPLLTLNLEILEPSSSYSLDSLTMSYSFLKQGKLTASVKGKLFLHQKNSALTTIS